MHLTVERAALRAIATSGHRPQALATFPGRVNLIGEHTDYSGGLCLPAAITMATTVALSPRTDNRVQIVSEIDGFPERVAKFTIEQARAGDVTGWQRYLAGVIWAFRHRPSVTGLNLTVSSTIPAGAGLSSSSAVLCAALKAVGDLWSITLSRNDLIDMAWHIENDYVGVPTGGMDPVAIVRSTPGEAVLIDCGSSHSPHQWSTTTVGLPFADHQTELLVVDTQVHHQLDDGAYAERVAQCSVAANKLNVPTLSTLDSVTDLTMLTADNTLLRRARHVVTENQRVRQAHRALTNSDATTFGRLMTQSHHSLATDFEVSCPELDLVVTSALAAGALGARMTGGGFGGSAVVLVSRAQTDDVCAAIAEAFTSASAKNQVSSVPTIYRDVV